MLVGLIKILIGLFGKNSLYVVEQRESLLSMPTIYSLMILK